MDIREQTKNVAAQGRYGDSMLLHVNPAEVKGLASAMPITVNPETGQPEAFLPFLAPILGSVLGPTLFASLGATGALTGLAGSALGSGLAQYAATGDVKKGLLAGLTGYGVGNALQAASGAAGASAATQAATDAATTAGTLGDVATQKAIQSATTQAGGEALKAAATQTPFQNLKSIFNPAAISETTAATAPDLLTASTTVDPTLATSFGNIATGLADPMAYIPAGIGMGATGIMESQELFEQQLRDNEEARRRRKEEMYARLPEPTLYGFDAGGNTNQGLPQVFAPARTTYNVNPDFMAGFNPETMYFVPSTVAAPASSLSYGAAPSIVDTYTGTKGGYGGNPLVISPEGRQAQIDPFAAYTGEAPAGLVSSQPFIDITGDDLGLPDDDNPIVEYEDIQTLSEQEGGDDFTFDLDDYLTDIDLSNINLMGQNYDFSNFDLTKFLNEYDPTVTQMEDMTNLSTTSADNLVNFDNLYEVYDPTKEVTDSFNNNLTTNLVDIIDFDNVGTGTESFTTTDNTFNYDDLINLDNSMNVDSLATDTFNNNVSNTNNVTDLLALDPVNTVDTLAPVDTLGTTTNLGMTDTLDTTTLADLDPISLAPATTLNPTTDITNPLTYFDTLNTLGLADNTANKPSMGTLTMAEGGALKPIPEDNKGLPNLPEDVRNEMGYMQAGGMTDIQNDPLTREVTRFILGETDDEKVLNDFITKYGSDAFMQLREAVLQSIVPNAQTEGLIKGDGEGGMDDDLRGMIGNKERIAVSQDEFIVPADVVSMLGDGSSDAGSKELYDMMDRVRKEKTGTTKQAPKLANAGGLLPA